jgi:drug/metabolite transporter (DMT)-like permease
VAFFLFDWGLKEIGIIKTDLFQYVQPLVATALAVLFLGDILHYSLIIGGVLIGLGTYWGTFGKEKHKHPSHHRS